MWGNTECRISWRVGKHTLRCSELVWCFVAPSFRTCCTDELHDFEATAQMGKGGDEWSAAFHAHIAASTREWHPHHRVYPAFKAPHQQAHRVREAHVQLQQAHLVGVPTKEVMGRGCIGRDTSWPKRRGRQHSSSKPHTLLPTLLKKQVLAGSRVSGTYVSRSTVLLHWCRSHSAGATARPQSVRAC